MSGELSVLTWNLFHGRAKPNTGRLMTREFAELIDGQAWDVALLQEVPPWWPPELAAAAGAQCVSALTSRNALLPLRRRIAERRPDLIGANGGGANAVLSRRPLREHHAFLLRRRPERRVVQVARTDDGVWVANLHASTNDRLAAGDVALAGGLALDLAGEEPLVFGGDLNLRDPGVRGLAHVAGHHVDHLFVHRLEACAPAVTLRRGRLSDHRPLMVTVRPRTPAGETPP